MSQLQNENEAKRRKISSLKEEKESLLKDRVESEGRTSNLKKLKQLEQKHRFLRDELDEHIGCDPEAMQKKGKSFLQSYFFSIINQFFSRKYDCSGEWVSKSMDRFLAFYFRVHFFIISFSSR